MVNETISPPESGGNNVTATTAHAQRTILFVDDERDIVTLVRTALERQGYDVLSATCGQSAMQVFSEHHDELDCVILDVKLPDTSGGELMDRMLAVNPAVPVIITSGYDRSRVEDVLDAGAAGFLAKPFDFSMLCMKLKETIAPATM
ncbi:MAG: response regulator [Armatimonadia bacterium]|nr:response regulator [Armatimonadia bacterium]